MDSSVRSAHVVTFVGKPDDTYAKSELSDHLLNVGARLLGVSQIDMKDALDVWDADDSQPLILPPASPEGLAKLQANIAKKFPRLFGFGKADQKTIKPQKREKVSPVIPSVVPMDVEKPKPVQPKIETEASPRGPLLPFSEKEHASVQGWKAEGVHPIEMIRRIRDQRVGNAETAAPVTVPQEESILPFSATERVAAHAWVKEGISLREVKERILKQRKSAGSNVSPLEQPQPVETKTEAKIETNVSAPFYVRLRNPSHYLAKREEVKKVKQRLADALQSAGKSLKPVFLKTLGSKLDEWEKGSQGSSYLPIYFASDGVASIRKFREQLKKVGYGLNATVYIDSDLGRQADEELTRQEESKATKVEKPKKAQEFPTRTFQLTFNGLTDDGRKRMAEIYEERLQKAKKGIEENDWRWSRRTLADAEQFARDAERKFLMDKLSAALTDLSGKLVRQEYSDEDDEDVEDYYRRREDYVSSVNVEHVVNALLGGKGPISFKVKASKVEYSKRGYGRNKANDITAEFLADLQKDGFDGELYPVTEKAKGKPDGADADSPKKSRAHESEEVGGFVSTTRSLQEKYDDVIRRECGHARGANSKPERKQYRRGNKGGRNMQVSGDL